MGVSTTKRAAANPLDGVMTPAQVARRKFKSGLPRKPQNRTLSINGALGETFTLLDTFRRLAPHPEETVMAALAFYRGSAQGRFAEFLTVPNVAETGRFCDAIVSLAPDEPNFLGVVFVQVDVDATNPEQRVISFAVPFMSGPDSAARLKSAQHSVLAQMHETYHRKSK